MKKYHFGYYEFIKKYKCVEIFLDEEVDPSSIAESLLHIDELITWEEDAIVNNESSIKFYEITSENERNSYD